VSDNYVHLTNNCLQKWGDHYGKHETGNTLSFEAFQQYLNDKFPQFSLDVDKHFVRRIKDLIVDSYLSAKKAIQSSKRRSAFELLGFDFLVDEDFRVWLLEVNTNPYLGIPNDFIADLLPKMIDDMLKIVVDPLFPPDVSSEGRENRFELLYCEVGSPFSSDGGSRNLRQPYSVALYPVPELAQMPMCRNDAYDVHRQDEEASPPPLDIRPKPVVKDILTTLREIVESSLDISDFFNSTNRILSKLKNQELNAEDAVANAGQALKMLVTCTSGLHSLIAYNHLGSLMAFLSSEDMPAIVQTCAVEAVTSGFSDTKFRKDMVKLGVVKSLIVLGLSSAHHLMLPAVVRALCKVSTQPLKGFYIPGETREHNWIRQQALQDGVLLCLFKIKESPQDEEVLELINRHLDEEFGLPDWEAQVNLMERSAEAGLDVHERLQDPEWREDLKLRLKEIISQRKELIKQKADEEQRVKQEEHQARLRMREEEDKLHVERKQRMEEQMLKRYEEMRRVKLLEAQKKVEGKQEGGKVDKQKRQALIEKVKHQEASKRATQAKKKQIDEEQRKVDEE
jgi:hypothetical protein